VLEWLAGLIAAIGADGNQMYYGPEFERQGKAATFVVEVLEVCGSVEIVATLQHRDKGETT
jgi:hypothetical protein